jgi:hypothetical protein
MREVEIPGGKAYFLEKGVDEIPGRAVKLIKAAGTAAATQLSEYPELFEEPREGETEEERAERLTGRLSGLRLTTDQAMAWDNLREATVAATLSHWTLDRRPPRTPDEVSALPETLWEALLDSVGGMSAADLEANFDPTGDPKDEVPTGSSGSSDGPSKAGPELTPTAMSSTAIAPSDGGDSSPEQ